jgi:hypothetical protein
MTVVNDTHNRKLSRARPVTRVKARFAPRDISRWSLSLFA